VHVVSTCVLHVQSLVLSNLTTLRVLCFDANCEVSRNVIFSDSLPASSLGSDKFAIPAVCSFLKSVLLVMTITNQYDWSRNSNYGEHTHSLSATFV
jgi:hypothetical protein